MRVADVMTGEVVAVGPFTPLKEVAALLLEHGISGLPVVDDEGKVVGIVSEADILMKERTRPEHSPLYSRLHAADLAAEELRLSAGLAAEAMSVPVIVIAADRPLTEAATLMLDNDVKRLPVVEGERLVGIVTRTDLVRAFLRPDEEIANEIREEVLLRRLCAEPGRIDVHVRQGRVTISGSVDTELDATLLPKLVERLPGVVSVTSSVRW